jgi:alanine dehydrogenase
MKNTVGIIREGLSKPGEKRVAITPEYAAQITGWGHTLIVQSAVNPKNDEIKRVFPDEEYIKAGAEISENLSPADLIFGLKEIHVSRILPDKAYFIFSHTHKGQIKNRAMLTKFYKLKTTLIDYELIADIKNNRLITAFTYNAGYAGMVDTLWTLGRRWSKDGTPNVFKKIPQAIEEYLGEIKKILSEVRCEIEINGTPSERPPVITAFLGSGKTSIGAQRIYDLLPTEKISLSEIQNVYRTGTRNKVYKIVLDIVDIYKLKRNTLVDMELYSSFSRREREHHYKVQPDLYETNLHRVLPFTTMLMNCVTWSPKYPRSVTKELMKEVYLKNKTLAAIGDITCDPNGSIEFSKEMWIHNPVFIYNPLNESVNDGFDGEGIAVMAVTNLPSEFSEDASQHFSEDLAPFLKGIVTANYKKTLHESGLPDEIKRGIILWKGEFSESYSYMKKYLVR